MRRQFAHERRIIHALVEMRQDRKLRAASLGNDAGLVGGVYYFRTQMGE